MEKLAICGGVPAVSEALAQTGHRPVVTEAAVADIVDMLHKGEISISPAVQRLEREFAA